MTGHLDQDIRQQNGAGLNGATNIIDSHVHFYDPTRVEGVPWPAKGDALLFRPMLPANYHSRIGADAVSRVVAIECSPWIRDNDWLLELASNNDFLAGVVGNLEIGAPQFAERLSRLVKFPKFRGIRVRHSILRQGLLRPPFIAGLQLLAQHDLSLDIYGGPELLLDLVKLKAMVPDLRVVVNHVANLTKAAMDRTRDWGKRLTVASALPLTFCKISALIEGVDGTGGTVLHDASPYTPLLDAAWNAFGADRLLYGSNWPVCERVATLAVVQSIPTEYFLRKGGVAANKVFSENATIAYQLPCAPMKKE